MMVELDLNKKHFSYRNIPGQLSEVLSENEICRPSFWSKCCCNSCCVSWAWNEQISFQICFIIRTYGIIEIYIHQEDLPNTREINNFIESPKSINYKFWYSNYLFARQNNVFILSLLSIMLWFITISNCKFLIRVHFFR